MPRATTKLRQLIRDKTFLHMPSVYDALGGRLVQSLGYEAVYVGGYVTDGSNAVAKLDELGTRRNPMTPEQFAEFWRNELEKYRAVAKATGVRME